MRFTKFLFLGLLLSHGSIILSQEYNPFKSIGKEGKILNAYGDKFVEVFDYDTIQRIGSILFNIKTRRIVDLLPDEKVFKKYSNNSSASRWYQVDPLSAKYPQWSPYTFVADNPIRYNDPDGREFIDQKGNHVSVTFGKDGALAFSKNANSDLVTLAKGMAKTEIGMTMLHTMADSKTKISMTIDREHVEYSSDGSIKAGTTAPTISQKTVNGQPVGDKYISKAAITIYEQGVLKIANEHDGKIMIAGKLVDVKNTPLGDILSSVGVHEGTHATDKGSSSSLSPNSTKAETERKPYENQLKHLQQLEQKQ